jgi:OmcA/MtrC family decaheme c-type cytochrome
MRSSSLSRIVLLTLAGLFLAGCEGDDGAPGPQGPEGPIGDQGPQGEQGPPGGGVPVSSAEKINVDIEAVIFESGEPPATDFTAAPKVVFNLTNDLNQGLTGMPPDNISFIIAQLTPGTDGGSSEWQAYTTADSGGIANAQAATETATPDRFTELGGGAYEYTFAKGLDDYAGGPVFDKTKTHRVGLEIRTERGTLALGYDIPANNAPSDFVPAGGDPTFTRLIVDNDTCNACHHKLELHGEARFDVEYCVQCHNPSSIDGDTVNEPWGGKLDMKVMIHKIHAGFRLTDGYRIIGYGGTPHDYSDVVFPQPVSNCNTCHDETDHQGTPQASNWRLVANRESCGSCHDDVDFANNGHPGGLTFIDDTQCLDCHGPDATVNNGEVQTARVHQDLIAIAGQAFKYEVVSVANTGPGQNPQVTIRVSDPTKNDTPYDIQDPAGPYSDGSARLRVRVAWTTAEFGNIDPNNELMRDPNAGRPIQPIEIDFLDGATNNNDGTFTKTASVPIPSVVTGSGVAILEGRPRIDTDGDGDTESIRVRSEGLTFPITDETAQSRRQVVDIGKCNDCHGQVSHHGSNRTDNPELCATCHNPNVTDINGRDGCAFGPDDKPADFKYMIHRIHSSGEEEHGGAFEIDCDVFEVEYPGRLNNCEACHKEDTYYPFEPSTRFATTIDIGDRSILSDDVAITPNAAVCSSCHPSELAREHMRQNGANFEASKNEFGELISANGVETCRLCHGPGRIADVKEMHAVERFDHDHD